MAQVGAYEAKTHLPRLLDEVERGSSITITRNGRPVARLMPVVDTQVVANRLLELRAQIKKGNLSMRKLIDEGRR